MKTKEKDEAVELRKSGLTYREILGRLPVSKSSLSYWLRVRISDTVLLEKIKGWIIGLGGPIV